MPTLTEQTEHYLAQEFALLLAVPQSRLQKSAALDEVFPPEERRRVWQEAAAKTELRFPRLHLSSRATWFGFSTAVGNAVRVAAVCVLLGATWAIVPATLATLVISGWVFYELSRPWAVWNNEVPTYGELVRWLVAHNSGKLRRKFGIKLNREEIFDIVRRVVVEQLGVRLEQVQWDTRFVDLGCD